MRNGTSSHENGFTTEGMRVSWYEEGNHPLRRRKLPAVTKKNTLNMDFSEHEDVPLSHENGLTRRDAHHITKEAITHPDKETARRVPIIVKGWFLLTKKKQQVKKIEAVFFEVVEFCWAQASYAHELAVMPRTHQEWRGI